MPSMIPSGTRLSISFRLPESMNIFIASFINARGAPPPRALPRRLRGSPFGLLTATLSLVEGSFGPQALLIATPNLEVAFDEMPRTILGSDVARRAAVIDAIEPGHRAVTASCADGALLFGGVAVSTATTA